MSGEDFRAIDLFLRGCIPAVLFSLVIFATNGTRVWAAILVYVIALAFALMPIVYSANALSVVFPLLAYVFWALPMCLAFSRQHRNKWAILLLGLISGILFLLFFVMILTHSNLS